MRYEIRAGGSADEWDVIDTATGEIVLVNGQPQTKLPQNEAADLAHLLNRLERQQPEQLI